MAREICQCRGRVIAPTSSKPARPGGVQQLDQISASRVSNGDNLEWRRLLQRRPDIFIAGGQVAPEAVDRGDDRERNTACNQSILDRSRTTLVAKKSNRRFHVTILTAFLACGGFARPTLSEATANLAARPCKKLN